MLAAPSGQEDGEEPTQRDASRSPRQRTSMTVDQALNELDQDSCAALANWQAGWVQQEKDEQVGNIFSFGSQSVKTRDEESTDRTHRMKEARPHKTKKQIT